MPARTEAVVTIATGAIPAGLADAAATAAMGALADLGIGCDTTTHPACGDGGEETWRRAAGEWLARALAAERFAAGAEERATGRAEKLLALLTQAEGYAREAGDRAEAADLELAGADREIQDLRAELGDLRGAARDVAGMFGAEHCEIRGAGWDGEPYTLLVGDARVAAVRRLREVLQAQDGVPAESHPAPSGDDGGA